MILTKRKQLTARKAPFLSERASHSLALPTNQLHYESLFLPEMEKNNGPQHFKKYYNIASKVTQFLAKQFAYAIIMLQNFVDTH